MLASGLASASAGILCHPVGGADRWQISCSNRCKSVMSNFCGSGLPKEGNNFSHCSSNKNCFHLRPSSFGRLLSNASCNVDPGCVDSRNFLRTFVPSSISSLANFVPFIFSSDLSATEGPQRPTEVSKDVPLAAMTYRQSSLKINSFWEG